MSALTAVPELHVVERTPSYSSSVDEKKTPLELADERDAPKELEHHGSAADDEPVEVGGVGLPWSRKIPVLCFILFLTFGSNWASSSLSPLKSTLKKELGINNAQYGVISSAVSLVNTVLPLFSGVLIDYYGPNIGSLTASSFIFVGQGLAAVGATIRSYPLIVVGEVVFGVGSTQIETSQSKLYAHYFKGAAGTTGYIGFVSGLDIGLGRVFNVVSKLASVPIAERTGNFAWSFWVPLIICAFTLLLNIVYVLFARTLPVQNRVLTGKRAAALAREGQTPITGLANKRSRFSYLGLFALPACFWILPLTQLLQAGTVGAYTGNLAEVVEITRGTTKLTAGYTSGIAQILPIVLTPALGLFFDRYGRRTQFIAGTAALWVLVFSLLNFSSCHPLIPTIFGSVALGFNALPFIASIPLLVPQAYLGTAMGAWKTFNSAGSTIMDVAVGAIQDKHVDAGVNQYDEVFYLLIALKAVDVIYGLGYDWFDRKHLGRTLLFSERQRVKVELEQSPEQRTEGLRSPVKAVTVVGIAVLLAMIVAAYVLFIYYSM